MLGQLTRDSSTFLFLSRPDAIHRLEVRLADVGLRLKRIHDSDSAYVPAIVELQCDWMLDRDIRLVWNRQWVDDGNAQEDSQVVFSVDGSQTGAFDIAEALRSRLTKSLTDSITDQIAEFGAKVTGKSC